MSIENKVKAAVADYINADPDDIDLDMSLRDDLALSFEEINSLLDDLSTSFGVTFYSNSRPKSVQDIISFIQESL